MIISLKINSVFLSRIRVLILSSALVDVKNDFVITFYSY